MHSFVIGVMSGTSLDGLDIAYCKFSGFAGSLTGDIIHATTVDYSSDWRSKLANARNLSDSDLTQLGVRFAEMTSHEVQKFIKAHNITQVDYVASHGHTVHHEPHKGITVQIGDGQVMADLLKLPVVYDFRVQDVALGGQGAPLVPIGDRDLYRNFDACINIGGFANISFQERNITRAFDICPANIILNPMAQKLGFAFDEDGKLAQSGQLLPELLQALNSLDYYQQAPPKSLGIEWVEQHIWPLVKDSYNTIDVLNTFTLHMANQIAQICNLNKFSNVLLSGGGALNKFLVAALQQNGAHTRIAPHAHLHFKEAFVFAYLGYLKWHNEINVLCSVTGAKNNHVAGYIALPNYKKSN